MTGSPSTLCAAFDQGINFFFLSADMHWPLYESARRGLRKLLERGRGIRDQVVVGAVSYVAAPEFCSAPFRELLDAVPGLERLDLLITGGAYASDFYPRLMPYQQHLRAGNFGARALGTTFHERPAAPLAIARELIDIAFIRYNAAHPGASEDLFPFLSASSSTLVYNFKSALPELTPARMEALGVGRDYWRPTVADHYRFVLTQPQLDGVLCALQTPRQVQALARALEQGPLDDEEQEHLLHLAALARAPTPPRRP